MNSRNNKRPDRMAAVRQYQPGGTLEIEQVEIPRPGPGEVLVKMGASPVNPSDLALLAGGYLERSYPFTPGLEGSGTIVEVGKGIFPRLRLGKRVACSPAHGGNGTWAEYMITSVMNTAPLPRRVSMEEGAMMLVNPMTAMAFIHMARQGKHRAMINNASASSLGKMLIRLTKNRDIPLINIVRREEQVDELKRMGATYVLNSSSESFNTTLRILSAELNATLILDAVTGSQTSILLDAAPRGATLVAYARLSGDPSRIDPLSLMNEEKKVTGFMLANWLQSKGLLFKIRFINSVRRELDGSLSSHISKSYPLERVEEAITRYREHMSEGKIILNIGSE
jgi:NADPH2:quinone reductase